MAEQAPASTKKIPLATIQQAIGQSQFAQAIDMCNHQLAQNPAPGEHIQLWYMLAVAQRLNKQPEHALETLHQLLELQPDHGRAFQEKGYCLRSMGQTREAAAAFYQATRFNPALISAWQQLLSQYQASGNRDALQLATQHLKHLQGLPRPVLGAYDLMYEGQLYKAEQVCRQFLQQHKHHFEAMLLLAELGIRMKVYHDAEFLLESCTTLYPQDERGQIAYQSLLLKLGKYPQAVSLARQRLQGNPDNLSALTALAEGLSGTGELTEAVAIYQQLLDINPDKPGLWLALGHLHKSSGALEAAISAYMKAAEYQPDLGDAYWSLANTKTYRFTDPLLEKMQQLEAEPNTGLTDRIHLCFALGKAYEDKTEYQQSFAFYQRGNRLQKSTLDFDIRRTEKALHTQQQVCDRTLFEMDYGHPATDPIFIVGLPRAGSTLLEQILSSHSQIDGTMELHDILGIASELAGQKDGYPHNLHRLSDTQCRALGQRYLDQTRAYRQGGRFFIDKMPNNFVHIGLIKKILPNARIIDARRDPLACCFSGYKQLFGDGQEFSYDLQDIGRYYKAYEQLMNHWHQVLPGQILTVQHESVLDDLEGQVRRLLTFIGVEFEAQCLEFYNTRRAIKTPSSEQVRQPIYQSGRHQYKAYTAYLTPLFEVLGQAPPQH
ncbi:sulfotransferase [Salinimonas marina]|uniref:Sulfotransferase n=1 Tax=Salinimonas marina TaxID=2785918 RepID=A0A7S9HE41_9ALTE|nr:tetratricopeptide repeat-containing sulfotransferase family protein [Salinimonas marina]QPG06830.1 sulfotransferase [Salinimonas marina]